MKNSKNKIMILIVYFSLIASLVSAAVSDHAFNIEMSKTYNYGDGQDQIVYEFDACIQVDNTVTSGSLQVPNGNTYSMYLEEDDGEIWLNFSFESFDLSDLAEFNSGTFIFTLYYANGGSDSTPVVYALSNGSPIPPVTQKPKFLYPLNGANDVLSKLTVRFEPATDSQWAFDLWFEAADDGVNALEKDVEGLPAATSSYGPVTLTPNVRYAIGLSIGHAIFTNNADGIPIVIDTDAELEVYVTTVNAKTEIQKCTVIAPAKYAPHGISFSGILNAIEADLILAQRNDSNVKVTLNAVDMLQPLEFVFPITDTTLRYGIFRGRNTNSNFLLNTKTGKMQFVGKGLDLTGLACPFYVTINIGDYSATFELNETIVNGPKKPCPLVLLQGVKNTLNVTRYKLIPGKTDNKDSFIATGFFTVKGTLDTDQPFVLTLGNQSFTIDGKRFKEKNGIFVCPADLVDEKTGILTVNLNYNKCIFKISMKNATVQETGAVDFNLSTLGYDLINIQQINLGQ